MDYRLWIKFSCHYQSFNAMTHQAYHIQVKESLFHRLCTCTICTFALSQAKNGIDKKGNETSLRHFISQWKSLPWQCIRYNFSDNALNGNHIFPIVNIQLPHFFYQNFFELCLCLCFCWFHPWIYRIWNIHISWQRFFLLILCVERGFFSVWSFNIYPAGELNNRINEIHTIKLRFGRTTFAAIKMLGK